ncbi:MAG: hypothetical protein M3178_15560, partial [Pseudomonadota bacterium]|nr:hypothetical protein [Pseudomonadota bacterium]
ALQPIIDIKKAGLPAHRITSNPSSKRESEMLELGQVFRSVQLCLPAAALVWRQLQARERPW